MRGAEERERERESEGLRPRRLGGGEREREEEYVLFDLVLPLLRGAGECERDGERDASLYESLRRRPRALLRGGETLDEYERSRRPLLRAGETLREYERPLELDRDRDLESRTRRGVLDRERERE